MTGYAWAVLAHVIIGLSIIGAATALAWNGTIQGGEAVTIYGTAIGLVGGIGGTVLATKSQGTGSAGNQTPQ